jgi:hypothetical protein
MQSPSSGKMWGRREKKIYRSLGRSRVGAETHWEVAMRLRRVRGE